MSPRSSLLGSCPSWWGSGAPGQDAGEAAGAQPWAVAAGGSAGPVPCQSCWQQSREHPGHGFADGWSTWAESFWSLLNAAVWRERVFAGKAEKITLIFSHSWVDGVIHLLGLQMLLGQGAHPELWPAQCKGLKFFSVLLWQQIPTDTSCQEMCQLKQINVVPLIQLPGLQRGTSAACGGLTPLCFLLWSWPGYSHSCLCLWQAVPWIIRQGAGMGSSQMDKLPGMDTASPLNLHHFLGCAFADLSP